MGYQAGLRRPGDPPSLVANAAKAREVLGWVPEYVEIASIIGTAWRYMERRRGPQGLPKRPLRQAR